MNSRSGRPLEVEGGQRCSILFGKRELRILAKAEQDQLAHRDTASRSAVVRQMVRYAWANKREDLQESWKKDLEVAELHRRLEQAEREKDIARREADAARTKARAKETVVQRLLQHLPIVRQKAATGIETPSGIPLLDQVWHNAGSWRRVLARLEEASRDKPRSVP
jgi:hypothetical protein